MQHEKDLQGHVEPIAPSDPTADTDINLAAPVTHDDSADSYAHFHSIDPDKQQRILRAALEEFAGNDYASASTNAIVKRAQISKGLLFHYFNDKLGLYLYLLNYVAEQLYSDVMGSIDLANDDIFDIMQKTIEAKLGVANRYVFETRLYLRAMTGDIPPRAKEVLGQSVDQAYEALAMMTALLNEDYLRAGLDKEKVVQSINWVCEGITNHLLATVGPETSPEAYDYMMSYTSEYFAFLRTVFYKEKQ
ncbi:MAG: TetR/AcrR family transcriptional regulator [Coriobacteriales bacterium]|jgi:AcrR family transcriptional regulator|nr:TetR/AcrR family transcriptional regulator [Coriobacteriales bacterium]